MTIWNKLLFIVDQSFLMVLEKVLNLLREVHGGRLCPLKYYVPSRLISELKSKQVGDFKSSTGPKLNGPETY